MMPLGESLEEFRPTAHAPPEFKRKTNLFGGQIRNDGPAQAALGRDLGEPIHPILEEDIVIGHVEEGDGKLLGHLAPLGWPGLDDTPARVIGLAIGALGIFLMLWAAWTMHRRFLGRPASHVVPQRHPATRRNRYNYEVQAAQRRTPTRWKRPTTRTP